MSNAVLLSATDDEVAYAKEGTIITENGLNMLAQACAGAKLTFTRIAFGDSIKNNKLVTPTDEQMVKFTALIHERDMTLPIADVRFAGNGSAVLKFAVNNSNLETGFWARELGVWAKIDNGAEKLYSYKNYGTLASYIIGGGGATAINMVVSLVTVVDQATNVTAIVDSSLLSVTAAEFTAHINSAKPHPNIPNTAKELNTSDFFWATGADSQLHPVSAENLSNQLLGGNLNQIKTINNRLRQTEINIGNLYTQLDVEKDLGLDANLLIFEDFIDCEAIDLFVTDVDHEVAGAQNVCVENIENIHEGHYYTISDGIRSQYAQVSSVAKNDNLYVVFFTEPLKYSFNLKKTKLYRTTGLIHNGKADGAGDLKDAFVDFSATVWTGSAADKDKTITLATTLKNKKKFTLSGNWAFTENGEFTLALT